MELRQVSEQDSQWTKHYARYSQPPCPCFHQRRVWNERRCLRHGACAGHRSLHRTDRRTDSLFLSCLSAAVSHHLLLLGRVDWRLCVETVCGRPLVSALQASSTPAFTHPCWQDLDSSWLLAIKATRNTLLPGHFFPPPCHPPSVSLWHTHALAARLARLFRTSSSQHSFRTSCLLLSPPSLFPFTLWLSINFKNLSFNFIVQSVLKCLLFFFNPH